MTCVDYFEPVKDLMVFNYDDIIDVDENFLESMNDFLFYNKGSRLVNIQNEISSERLLGDSGFYYLYSQYAPADDDYPNDAFFMAFGTQEHWNKHEEWLRSPGIL